MKYSLPFLYAASAMAAPAVVYEIQSVEVFVGLTNTWSSVSTYYSTEAPPQPTQQPQWTPAAPGTTSTLAPTSYAPAQTKALLSNFVVANAASNTPAPQTTAQAAQTTTLAPKAVETTSQAPAQTTAQAQTSAAASASSGNSFQDSILAEHNSKRALHGVSALSWSDELASYAQNYANNYDCSGNLVHSHGKYGENLAAGYANGAAAVDAWYGEISSYDFNNPGFSMSTGHFTQVVWKSTTQVGCGIKYCGSTWQNYVICSYSPAGNVIGQFPQNVLPLK